LSFPFRDPKSTSEVTRPLKNEIAVVGESWKVDLVAQALGEVGYNPLRLVTRSVPRRIPVFLGTGDCYHRARLLYGESVARIFWELSFENYRRASLDGEGLIRHAGNEIEKKWFEETGRIMPQARFEPASGNLYEPGMSFDSTEITPVENFSFRAESNFCYELDWGKNQTHLATVSTIIFVSEEEVWNLLPAWRDRMIAVTLSEFVFPKKKQNQGSLFLFNGGADFAVAEGKNWRLGSYRNLYQDKAVGIHSHSDPATLAGVTAFFSKREWIEPAPPQKVSLTVDAVTCDGLPLVGSLAEHPGVFVMVGFAGHAANFIFALAPLVAAALAGRATNNNSAALSLFSPRRFA
jgi:hypothetical protein